LLEVGPVYFIVCPLKVLFDLGSDVLFIGNACYLLGTRTFAVLGYSGKYLGALILILIAFASVVGQSNV
jgi:hypothetical protein